VTGVWHPRLGMMCSDVPGSCFGAVAGGLLASSVLGLRTTILVAAVGVTLAAIPFLAGPIRSLRTIPGLAPASN
jgi:hypothetical protein